MLRIMAWNIERFGINKLLTNRNWDKNASRRAHIRSTIETVAPHLIVVQEVQTTWTAFGDLISGGAGPAAVRSLREWLVGRFPGDEWSLVPPVVLNPVAGYAEGIGVFFDANRLSFEGPMVWTKAGIRPAGGVAVPALYPKPWKTTMPEAASHTPPGTPQNRLAGQYKFLNGAARLEFGGPRTRSLWQTRFWDKVANRYLDLYSLHFPPQLGKATSALKDLATYPPFRVAPAPAEDRVIIGDFNINANSANGALFEQFTDERQAIAGAPIVPLRYRLVFEAAVRRTTTVRRVLGADTTGSFPLYGYSARNAAGRPKALDNALVIRGGGRGAPRRPRVVNRVVFPPIDMARTIPQINRGLPLGGGAPKKQFNTLVNFGHIGGGRGASDHLPIVFDLP